MTEYPAYDFAFVNAARSGNNVWSNLVRLSRDVQANDPLTVILDHANGIMNEATMEAIIRRILGAGAKLILLEAPTWGTVDYHDNALVTQPTNQAAMATVNALAAHYDVPIVPVWEWCKTVVPGTYDLDELFLDGVHPGGEATKAYIADALKSELAQGLTRSGALPARLYACEDYENEATILTGVEYTSKTGTWAEDGTSVTSDEIGATITYSATCQSIGCYRNDSTSNLGKVEVSIDGGAYAEITLYQNGVELAEGRAAHTITIKVVATGVRIDEFWAI